MILEMGLSWWDFEQEQTSNEILMPGGGVKGRLFDFSHMWAWAQGFLQSLKI